MATITVNGADVEIGDNERLNLVDAAKRAGVEIPHYCYHSQLTVVASCRMCLVEVGEKKPDGTIAMQPKVLPACQTPAKNGTVVVTNSEKAKAAQSGTLEYILLNHPLDCPICDQAGECFLQDYSYKFGKPESRLQEPKTYHPDKHHIGDQIVLFTDRCVMCSRCVRFTREISGSGELQIINRGNHAEIDVFPGQPCNNPLAGNVVDICPVGALCSKDFLYKQRVWWLQSTKSVCPNCSTGCSINVDQNDDRVYRLKPRVNPQAQGHFMCDAGRFGFKYIHSEDRLKTPVVRSHGTSNGRPPEPAWTTAITAVRDELTKRAPAVAAVFSPWMTCEEAFLLASWLKELSPAVKLAMGPVPVVGEDDTFPKSPSGKPLQPVRFTIRAEKCPNRAGVAAVLEHFEGKVVDWTTVAPEVDAGRVTAAFVVGGYNEQWADEKVADVWRKPAFLAVLDILPSALSNVADVVLAGGSFAEKDGTFVNHAGLAQAIRTAIHAPGDARPDGRILMELVGRRGLFHAPTVRKEMAAAIPYFASLESGDPGELGVALVKREPAAAGV